MIEQENTVPENANLKTPPTLVRLGEKKQRKSSVKRVRFSLDTEASSPVRLNRDLPPELGEIFLRRSSGSATTNRSSSSSSSPPLHFPSQEEMLMISSTSGGVPAPSPGDSRQSTGSSINGVLGNALSSFGPSQFPSHKSIWDTPSENQSSANVGGPNNLSPVRRIRDERDLSPSNAAAETPGFAERRFLGFSVLENNNPDDSCPPKSSLALPSPQAAVRVEPHTSPRRNVINPPEDGDDPLLMSGASSIVKTAASSGSRRRRRRLSSLEDMESELMNVSSPERISWRSIAQVLASEGVDIEQLLKKIGIEKLFLEREADVRPEAELPDLDRCDSFLLNVYAQQVRSVELSIDSAIHWVSEMLVESRRSLEQFSLDQLLKQEADGTVISAITGEKQKVEFLKKTIKLRLLENQELNLRDQTGLVLHQYGEELEVLETEVDRMKRECCDLTENVAQIKAEQIAPQLNEKFIIQGNEGEYVRRKSSDEVRLEQLDQFIQDKEADIIETISEITELESVIEEKQQAYSEASSKMRAFYEKNGWNIMAELPTGSGVVLVYCVCHILVFEKALNDSQYWRLNRIVPADFDPAKPPAYAENLFSNQVMFSSASVLEQIMAVNCLRSPFKYDPPTLHALMGAATSALCEWVELREMLAQAVLISESSCIKINCNMQIEAVVAAHNTSMGIELPLCVKLLWFDPLFVPEAPVNYSNFSYLISECLESAFPRVREQLDNRFSSLIHRRQDLSTPSSLLMADIVKAVLSVLINAEP